MWKPGTAGGLKPSLSCDFENDLCGWTQDPSNNFDWTRQNYGTPTGHLGTGPSYDHTLGEGNAGKQVLFAVHLISD